MCSTELAQRRRARCVVAEHIGEQERVDRADDLLTLTGARLARLTLSCSHRMLPWLS